MEAPRDHPLYWTWWGIKTRCSNPKQDSWPYYGGRGIRIWEPWRRDFWAFAFYMGGDKPSPHHSVDRIDVNGHYEPGNVRWATRKEQAGNKVLKSKKPKPVKLPRPKKLRVSKPKSPPKPKKVKPLSDDPDERALELLLEKFTRSQIANHLGIKKQNLTRWRRVPPHHVPKVAELTGLPRDQICPSLFA